MNNLPKIEKTSKRLTKNQKQEIIELYKSGNYTMPEIAKHYNVATSTIWNTLHKVHG